MELEDKKKNSMPVPELDATLAEHPFGNSIYITEQMHVSYLRRLESLSTALPIAGVLHGKLNTLDASQRHRVLGDTVVRAAVQHAQVQSGAGIRYGMPLSLCEEVLSATVRCIDAGVFAPLGSGLRDRISADTAHGWIWDEDCADSVFKQAFHYLLEMNYGSERPCTPTPDEVEVFRRAVRLLGLLLPQSSASALPHTHLVAVFPLEGVWNGRMSSSEFRVSGTIFLSRRLLANPWILAEHLYHETLHQQFYDLRAGHCVLQPEFARTGAPLIHSPWNRPDAGRNNYWDVHRALAAFHVYVHLALLCAAAEQNTHLQQEYGAPVMVGRRTSLVRAHYLHEQLRKVTWDELGAAGHRFIEWFALALDVLDPMPPAEGADAHLLLDRYWREALAVHSLLSEENPELARKLAGLIDGEVAAGRRVLEAMRVDDLAFNQALAEVPTSDPLAHFVKIRNVVARGILQEAPLDFRLSESGDADELVRQMVEGSSEVIRHLLEPEAPPQEPAFGAVPEIQS